MRPKKLHGDRPSPSRNGLTSPSNAAIVTLPRSKAKIGWNALLSMKTPHTPTEVPSSWRMMWARPTLRATSSPLRSRVSFACKILPVVNGWPPGDGLAGQRFRACDFANLSTLRRAARDDAGFPGDDSHGLSCRRPCPREAFRDDRGHAEGPRAESKRPRRHRARRRRARFRHARQRQGSGDRRDPPRRDQISAGVRHRAAARGDRQEIQAREQSRLQAGADHRRHRRQADPVQRLHGDAEPRRRGGHPEALLGELSRDGGDLRRHVGLRRHLDRQWLQADGRRRWRRRSRRRRNGW